MFTSPVTTRRSRGIDANAAMRARLQAARAGPKEEDLAAAAQPPLSGKETPAVAVSGERA
jgi:hypothetical protein